MQGELTKENVLIFDCLHVLAVCSLRPSRFRVCQTQSVGPRRVRIDLNRKGREEKKVRKEGATAKAEREGIV